MIYPNRFPFDVLDPAPDRCCSCGCRLADGRPEAECHYPAACDCHEEWRAETDEVWKRWLWGDK